MPDGELGAGDECMADPRGVFFGDKIRNLMNPGKDESEDRRIILWV